MTDEPQSGGDGRPKILNSVTGWIGGLTAVVLALAGLKAATGQLNLFGPAEATETEQVASTDEGGGEAEVTAETATEEAAALPSSYSGVWQGNNVTLEWRNGVWVETTEQGEEAPAVIHYEQLSRDAKMTNAIDRTRDTYVRWPTDGGTVEESTDGDTWTRSYELTKA